MKVGFVGLGMQGAPIAERIIAAGYPTTLWARRPAALEPFAGTVAVAPSLPELGAAVDLVGVCVFTDSDVEEVLGGPSGLLAGMRPGSIVAIHSTVNPETSRRMAELAAAGGVRVVDAPVSGSAPAARAGRLLVMVGGDGDVVARARPVFETFGNPVVHVGEVGAGQLVKLVNNVVLAANFSVLVDAVGMARGFGVDQDVMLDVLRHGTGASRAIDHLPENTPIEAVGGRVRTYLGKDSETAFEVARALGAPTGQLPEVVERLWVTTDPG